MLYPENAKQDLSPVLFMNPTSEYRGTPFWAWNCQLDSEILKEQIGFLHEMGFGGFHMHSRSGMATEYLSDDFMNLIKGCTEEAKKRSMLAWLYDEDRWPSGAAGGLLTCNPQYRTRQLIVSKERRETDSFDEMMTAGHLYLLACYDIVFDQNNKLASYRKINPDEKESGVTWYAYIKTQEESPWYNNQTYVDTLNKEAMDGFINLTHKRYQEVIGENFGKTVPAIFSDEPQFQTILFFRFPNGADEAEFPWTFDFAEGFEKSYGYDLLEKLPEVLWELPDSAISIVRYHFHDYLTERFVNAFPDNLGRWCEENGLRLTGHMMNEQSLWRQTVSVGEVMRSYRAFQLPGIDMLCNNVELNTAKQCQSAVHQYGREGMLSEMYGVTNWDFDFRDHKFQGDWQAALGVTVRVPHLSWVSMAGEAKRDYPASINYQSPWFREYSYVEDHFARVNTALTRGKAVVKVAVVHPIESFWLHCGPDEQTKDTRDYLDTLHQNMTEWLLLGLLDFDFISESQLPHLYQKTESGLRVGEMTYDVVLLPNLETMRRSTYQIIQEFRDCGGQVIFAGQNPAYLDAKPTSEIEEFCKKCKCIPFDKTAVLNTLEEARLIDIRESNGQRTCNLLYALREDGDAKWLFIAHAKEPKSKELSLRQDITLKIKGCYTPILYDTLSGQTKEISFDIQGDTTIIPYQLYAHDSILIKLERPKKLYFQAPEKSFTGQEIRLPATVGYRREEPNVLLLDRAKYALDDGPFQPEEDILRLDDICRNILGFPLRSSAYAQPWAVKPEEIKYFITLRFTIFSDIELEDVKLALEDADQTKITLNGEAVSSEILGYYVDHAIKMVALPNIHAGENCLELVAPLGLRTNTECCYLLGEFGVRLEGRRPVLCKINTEIGFGSITSQGMPFYGGNLTYFAEFDTKKDGTVRIRANYYRGALMRMTLDGEDLGIVAYDPYLLIKEKLPAGHHVLAVTVFGNRFNTFGGLHILSEAIFISSEYWRTKDYSWSYEYSNLRETGLLASPVIEWMAD